MESVLDALAGEEPTLSAEAIALAAADLAAGPAWKLRVLRSLVDRARELAPHNLTRQMSLMSPAQSDMGSPGSPVATPPLGDRDGCGGVVVFGSINMDLIAEVPTFPQADATTPAEAFNTKAGGKGANVAVAIARLGVPTHMVGLVGDDDFGRIMLARLSSEGVDTTNVQATPGSNTGVAMIMVAKDKSGKSTIPCLAANELAGDREISAIAALFERRPDLSMLVIQLEVALPAVIAAARLAHQQNRTIVLKASPVRPGMQLPDELFQYVSVLLVNEYEAPCLLGWPVTTLATLAQGHRAAKELQEKYNIPTVILVTTMGHVLRTRNVDLVVDTFTLPYLKVDIRDLIGAADALCGGFVAALSRGLSLRYAMLWGVCCGSLSTMELGAQDSMPRSDVLQKFVSALKLGIDPSLSTLDPWPDTMPAVWRQHGTLVDSVLTGDHGAMLSYLSAQENVSQLLATCVDFQGQSLLHLAVLMADFSAVCILLQNGASPFHADRYGCTVIDRAHELQCVKQWQRFPEVVREYAYIVVILSVARFFALAKGFVEPLSKYDPELLLQKLVRPLSSHELPSAIHSLLLERSIPFCQEYILSRILLHLQDSRSEDPLSLLFENYRNAQDVNFFHAAAFAGNLNLLRELYKRKRQLVITSVSATGMTPLHFAATGTDLAVCRQLLTWGLKLHTLDQARKSPLDYCLDENFRRQLAVLGDAKDIFVSYGHHPDVDRFARTFVKSFQANGVSLWIDFQDIESGSDWRDAIDRGIRNCRVFVVVLSRKWVNSRNCAGEFKLAMQENKPIFVIMPPLSANESISVDAIPKSISLSLTGRQFFYFTSPDNFEQDLLHFHTQFLRLIKQHAVTTGNNLGNTSLFSSSREQEMPSVDYAVNDENLIDGVLPKSFVFLACGGDCLEGNYAHIAFMLGKTLKKNGIPVMVARKSHDMELLQSFIRDPHCALFVLVVTQEDDRHFLSTLLGCASECDKPVIAAPFGKLEKKVDPSLRLKFFSSKPSTVPFVDWLEHDEAGSFERTQNFHDMFRLFECEMHQLTNGVFKQPVSPAAEAPVELSSRAPCTAAKAAAAAPDANTECDISPLTRQLSSGTEPTPNESGRPASS